MCIIIQTTFYDINFLNEIEILENNTAIEFNKANMIKFQIAVYILRLL